MAEIFLMIALLFLILWVLTDDDTTIFISAFVILICILSIPDNKNISINNGWNTQNINQSEWTIINKNWNNE